MEHHQMPDVFAAGKSLDGCGQMPSLFKLEWQPEERDQKGKAGSLNCDRADVIASCRCEVRVIGVQR